MERKILTVLFLLAIAGYGFFFFVIKGRSGQVNDTRDTPMQLVDSTDTFATALTQVLNSYYQLAVPLTKDDNSQLATLAASFAETAGQLPVDELKADSNLVKLTRSFQTNMVKAAGDMRNAGSINEQRKQLQIISDLLFDLLRTTQYKGNKVYLQFCPMAFDNVGANWLSASPAISNPYMGKAMPACGSVIDSINFRP